MKRIFLIGSMVVLTFVGSPAGGQDGYRGPGVDEVDVLTVEIVKILSYGCPVTLRGKLECFLGYASLYGDAYLFTDETGSIVVGIDDELWSGISVDENDMVEITGNVQRSDHMGGTVKASRLRKL
jgi:uncharacterized protein (TIGR00156 family)